MEQEKGGHDIWRVCDARRSESKALPVAQFVNAAHDANLERGRSCVCEHSSNTYTRMLNNRTHLHTYC